VTAIFGAPRNSGVLEQFAQFGLDGCHLGGETIAVLMLCVGVPGFKQPAGQYKAGVSEDLLVGEPLAVKSEVAL